MKRKKKQTIGLIINNFSGNYQVGLTHSVEKAAIERDINLIIFKGRDFPGRDRRELFRNKIYNYAGWENLDGLLIVTGSLALYADQEQDFLLFLKKLPHMPVISIGNNYKDIPSILLDNTCGMRELIVHLIEVHKYRNFAFIRGPLQNRDSCERYDVFINTLGEYHLHLNEKCVIQGEFDRNSGVNAIRELIDNHHVPFDVIVSSNDEMAFGVLCELENHGISVPREVAVTGYDNIEYTGYSIPSLTTVNQPFDELGGSAVKVLLDSIAGKDVPKEVYIRTRFIARESCGCFSWDQEKDTFTIDSENHDKFPENILKKRNKVITRIKSGIPVFCDRGQNHEQDKCIKLLFDTLINTIIKEEKNLFMITWDDYVSELLLNGYDISECQRLLTALRHAFIPYIHERKLYLYTSEILHKAENIISRKGIQGALYNQTQKEQESRSFQILRDDLLVAYNLENIKNVLTRDLPGLGINTFFLFLYEQNDTGTKRNPYSARLILACRGKIRMNMGKEGIPLKTGTLLPGEILVQYSRYSMIVESLVYSGKQLGFILLEYISWKSIVYKEINSLLSHSLQNALLIDELKNQKETLKIQTKQLNDYIEILKETMGGVILTMSRAVEIRDPYTAGHQKRVAELARAIAAEMDLSSEAIESIQMAGTIHDLGKIYIPADILNRPGKLDDLEFGIIKKHPQVAYDILKNIDFPWPIANIILQHHERIDGSGYPNRLKGDQILMESRILSVADVVEAMASFRPYREPLGITAGLEEIGKNKGILYDTDVVNSCYILFLKRGFRFPSN
ncbi:MAG: substrate-binding domain-containing protein [Spirochaetales bacterium]|nr:substrate-binding domain-containing protein [Spirochaetales bacterium]